MKSSQQYFRRLVDLASAKGYEVLLAYEGKTHLISLVPSGEPKADSVATFRVARGEFEAGAMSFTKRLQDKKIL